MNPCALIPVFNHGATVGAMVEAVSRNGLPCVLVDDGSEPGCASVLDALAAANRPQVHLLRLAYNQGKGAAVVAGMRLALRLGFSHALQIDADGQHDTADIPVFLALCAANPDALICGYPIFDEDVPQARLLGRYLTHVWVWINTLSFAARDAMCGFRVYPLADSLTLINEINIGQRMNFDIDILVRLYWRGTRIINQPTRVRYPLDGVSHFGLWRDNLLISSTHARLFFGMLLRFPRLIWRNIAS